MKKSNKDLSVEVKCLNGENINKTNNLKNQNQNENHNTKKEALGPNTKR